jgi:hypothetical protein
MCEICEKNQSTWNKEMADNYAEQQRIKNLIKYLELLKELKNKTYGK